MNDDLLSLSRHVLYEMWMLDRTTHALQGITLANEEVPDWLENALLEGFAIHARALTEFFYDGRVGQRASGGGRRAKSQPARGYAHDFFDDDAWRKHRPKPKPKALHPIAGRVGQEIGHLTYGRAPLASEAKTWEYGTIFLELARTWKEFLRVVPADRVVDDFLEQGWSLLPATVRYASPPPEDRLSLEDSRAQALAAAAAATAGIAQR